MDSAFEVEEKRTFLDGQFVCNIYNKDSKFYLIGKGGFSFSNDKTQGAEQFEASKFRTGSVGIRMEQFLSSQFIVFVQGTQKFFFDKEKRYAVVAGLNYIF